MTSNRLALVVSMVTLFVLSACGSSASSAAPSPIASAPRASSPSVAASSLPVMAQTDTEWGRIWDTLPSGFPNYPGSTPGDETATGPASANLVVDGLDAKRIVTLLQTLLQQAGYTTVGLSGPLEDGGYVLDMAGTTAGCKLQITATPTGGLTMLTILYGAACPND